MHDNARTRALLEHFGWEIFEHPPYSPDLAFSDHNLFLHIKIFLGGQSLGSDQAAKEVVHDWLKGEHLRRRNTKAGLTVRQVS
jgi:hypothetical protein